MILIPVFNGVGLAFLMLVFLADIWFPETEKRFELAAAVLTMLIMNVIVVPLVIIIEFA